MSSSSAPEPIGPYSQAVVSGNLIFCSGQIGLTADGQLAGDNVEVQARQALENLTHVIRAAGSDWDQMVRVEVYLTDLGDFAIFNDIYETYCAPSASPARVTVGVAALPKGACIEISGVAEL